MTLTDADRARLAEALDALAARHARRFEDRLWLAFGDQWTQVRSHLVQSGFVRYPRNDRDEPTITPTGQVLLRRLASPGTPN